MSDTPPTGQPVERPRRRHWFNRRDVRFILFVAMFVSGFYLWGHLTGPGRLTERLADQLNAGQARLNIVVTSKFSA